MKHYYHEGFCLIFLQKLGVEDWKGKKEKKKKKNGLMVQAVKYSLGELNSIPVPAPEFLREVDHVI